MRNPLVQLAIVIGIILLGLIGILAWHDAATQVVVECGVQELTNRVAELEKAHKVDMAQLRKDVVDGCTLQQINQGVK